MARLLAIAFIAFFLWPVFAASTLKTTKKFISNFLRSGANQMMGSQRSTTEMYKVRKGVINPMGYELNTRTGRAKLVTPDDIKCVMCQFWLQRVEGDAALALAQAGDQPIMLQTEEVPAQGVSLVETGASAKWEEKRFRGSDMLAHRPKESRMVGFGTSALPAATKAQEDYFYSFMFNFEYQKMHELCAQRSPAEFFHLCGDFLGNWRDIIEGLWYRDRVEHICMKINFCSVGTYIRRAAHRTFSPGGNSDLAMQLLGQPFQYPSGAMPGDEAAASQAASMAEATLATPSPSQV